MARWFVLAFSFLLVPVSSPSQTDGSKEAKKMSIQGKVIEAKGGQQVRKVNVEGKRCSRRNRPLTVSRSAPEIGP